MWPFKKRWVVTAVWTGPIVEMFPDMAKPYATRHVKLWKSQAIKIADLFNSSQRKSSKSKLVFKAVRLSEWNEAARD